MVACFANTWDDYTIRVKSSARPEMAVEMTQRALNGGNVRRNACERHLSDYD